MLKSNAISARDGIVNSAFEPFCTQWLLTFYAGYLARYSVLHGASRCSDLCLNHVFWTKALLMPLRVAFVGAELITCLLKYAVNQAWPIFLDGITEYNPSFPSGHATASTVVLGFVGFVVIGELASPRRKIEAAFWFGIAILAICFSRLFLSLHYGSDVLAGFFIGSIWLLIGVIMAQRNPSRAATPASL